MKPDKDIKSLWREAAQGDNTRLQPITSGEAEKAAPEDKNGNEELADVMLRKAREILSNVPSAIE